ELALVSISIRFQGDFTERSDDKVMKEPAALILTRFDFGGQAIGQQGRKHIKRTGSVRGWNETDLPMLKIRGTYSESSGFYTAGSRSIFRSGRSSPFVAIQHETRSINRGAAPELGVSPLAVGKSLRSPAITPAQVIPIINVERHRNKILPEFR